MTPEWWSDHGCPLPWRAEPSASRRPGAWVVLDGHGRIIADRMPEALAVHLARSVSVIEELEGQVKNLRANLRAAERGGS